MSQFVSTRNSQEVVNSAQAIVNGLSTDGGLYAPVHIPTIDYHDLLNLNYKETAAAIISKWFDDFSYDEIYSCCDEAYDHFDTVEVCPVVNANGTFITELFHGETCAFKDVALSFLPRIMVKAQRKLGMKDKILILTATSGDTGSAAMNGFKNVDGTGIIVFYPSSGVSDIQRKQMVCMKGKNVTACAVNGNFDDCQTAVKNAFATLPAMNGISLSSANSINIARLVPQIVYYFTTYIQLLKQNKLRDGAKLCFIVPTGNFGDILAGYYAKRMGLPVDKLICASNANNVLTDFFNNGVYDKRREFLRTWSPSMDILISSNLERLLYHSQHCNTKLVESQMKDLKAAGYYRVSDDTLKALREDFEAYFCDDAKTTETIRNFLQKNQYVLDPHTAVAVSAETEYKKAHAESKCAVLSTASPFKFPVCIFSALGQDAQVDAFALDEKLAQMTKAKIPMFIDGLNQQTELHTDVINKEDINNYIVHNADLLLNF